jgi:DNA-binding response OmpR family regulator
MKYALVLESNSETCNTTAALVASMGYLVTPVFSPKKALHAAHMIQFDLIVTCTASIPGDRRSLTGELSRCSPDALLILVTELESNGVNAQFIGVNAIINRAVISQDLKNIVDRRGESPAQPMPLPLPPRSGRERRRRAVD